MVRASRRCWKCSLAASGRTAGTWRFARGRGSAPWPKSLSMPRMRRFARSLNTLWSGPRFPRRSARRALPKRWAVLASWISMRTPRGCRADGASVLPSRRPWCRRRTLSCWTSPRTISTLQEFSGSNRFSGTRRSPAWWSATTATSWKISRMKWRSSTAPTRKTKQIITLENVSFGVGSRTLFKNIHFSVMSGMRIGLVGPNGSGKTTLLRLMRGDVKPESGKVRRAEGLRVVYFDQNRELDPDITLRRALAPDSDAVIYQDRVIHVASWAERFLFSSENLNQRVGRLSGGERARVLIAQLMLQPADVLLLDEPTNDLDIPTLEILEESLLEYPGALVLVTHDRFMLDRVSTVVVGLDGLGSAERFADYSQWEVWQRAQSATAASKSADGNRRLRSAADEAPRAAARKKLSYSEAREFATIESRIAEAERELHTKRGALDDPAITSNRVDLQNAWTQLDEAQKLVDNLYTRWAELEQKQS